MTDSATRVLIVDDSLSMRVYLSEVLERWPETTLVGMATDGEEGVALAAELAPDVVLMDLQLPLLDGVDAIRQIMTQSPVPVVVLSAQGGDQQRAFAAIRAGALEVLAKPDGSGDAARFERRLVHTLTVLANVKVKARRAAPWLPEAPTSAVGSSEGIDLLVIGCSTGGPPLLHTILSAIRPVASVPILITQHITAGFDVGFALWLSNTGHDVRVATEGEPLVPGRVYVAPAEQNLVLRDAGHVGTTPAIPNMITPSVDELFASVALFRPATTWAVLLTGMGRDGAQGLRELVDEGGTALVQDEATSVIWGMPGEAVRLGAVRETLPDVEIVRRLAERFSGP